MKNFATSVVAVIALVGALGASATLKTGAQSTRAMTNQDVIDMVGAGLGEQVIANAIRQAPSRSFDLSPTALIDLKRKRVSDAIIAEMQKAAQIATPNARDAARPAVLTPSITREQAAELLGRSDLFTQTETIIVKLGLSCAAASESDADFFSRTQAEILNPSISQNRGLQVGGIATLRAAGLLQVQESSGCGVDRQRGASKGTVTTFTPQGIVASKQWRMVDQNTWEVPMARRSVVNVTGVKGDAQSGAADFSWRWVPLQSGVEVAARFVVAQAIFEKYDDGWRLNRSRLRDYFVDGFGKVIVPPAYISVTPPDGAGSNAAIASAPASSIAVAVPATVKLPSIDILTSGGFKLGSRGPMCSLPGPDGPCQVAAFVGAETAIDRMAGTCAKLDRATYIGRCSAGKLEGLALVNANGSAKNAPDTILSYFSEGRISYPALASSQAAGSIMLGIDEGGRSYGCVLFGRWDRSSDKDRKGCIKLRGIYGDSLFTEAAGRAILDGSFDLVGHSNKLRDSLTQGK